MDKQKGQTGILIVVGILVLVGVAGGAYYLGMSNKVEPVPQPVPRTVQSVTPTPESVEVAVEEIEEISNWKTYNTDKYSFKYPGDWEVLTEVPGYYRSAEIDFAKETWVQDHLKSKMFAPTCRGPILRSTKVNTTIIAFEVMEKSPDGSYCWSNGHFTDTNTRMITTFTPPRKIEIAKWKPSDYNYPVTQGNSGKLYSPEWKGDLFQQTYVDGVNLSATIALVYQDKTDNSAEKVFDQILSTFKFIN